MMKENGIPALRVGRRNAVSHEEIGRLREIHKMPTVIFPLGLAFSDFWKTRAMVDEIVFTKPELTPRENHR
jgi:hypothetical protein